MKQSISSIWLLSLILIFILIFACFITITINYSRSFKLKNEVLTIIQKHHGLTDNPGHASSEASKLTGQSMTVDVGAFQTINLYLRGSAYEAEGYCPQNGGNWSGVTGIYGNEVNGAGDIEPADPKKKYYYCIAKYESKEKGKQNNSLYYKVRLFYKFEVPVLSDFFSIRVEGMTDEIYNPAEDTIDLNSSTDEDFFITAPTRS